jgi:biotin synthase
MTLKGRLRTMQHAPEAGLLIGACLEPVGPERAIDERVAKTVITRDARPVCSSDWVLASAVRPAY